jgi:Flp pilus assembly protein TadD
MPRRDRFRWCFLTSIAALGLLAGCNQLSSRPREHSSAALLDSGPQPKVTDRQAADIQVALGRSHEEDGRPEDAESAYRSALERDPRRADAETRLAILSDKKGDATAADKHFARALKLKPKDPEILCDQGYSLYLRRRWADAEASLRKAIALDRSHARSHTNLGLVLARRGDTEAALREFALAGCDPSDARANLGLVLALEGRLEEAKKEYRLALTAKPKSPVALEGLKAATVALTGRADTRALAASGAGGSSKSDPAVSRTSADLAR